jgi:hypothetical protein
MINFMVYRQPGVRARFTNIPIDLLEVFKISMKNIGMLGGLKVRYRGPRAHRSDSRNNKDSYCLKQDAKTFSVYTL